MTAHINTSVQKLCLFCGGEEADRHSVDGVMGELYYAGVSWHEKCFSVTKMMIKELEDRGLTASSEVLRLIEHLGSNVSFPKE